MVWNSDARCCAVFNSSLPVLYISGGSTGPGIARKLESGTRGFLAKPFRGEELLRKVREMLLTRPGSRGPAEQLTL